MNIGQPRTQRHIVALTMAATLLAFPECNSRRSQESDDSQKGGSARIRPAPDFDRRGAFALLLRQTDFGPRSPGSPGHAECLNFLMRELSASADTVILQEFPQRLPDGRTVQGSNVIARFQTSLPEQILLSAHWDTRPFADEDPEPSNRSKPILGANDGASGVAVLLQLARHLAEVPPPVGIDIVLFDLEDLGSSGVLDSWSLGSQYFARNLPPPASYRFGINIDMVGDKNLQIRREQNSETYASSIMDMIFTTASQHGIYQFLNEPGEAVFDDHIPLNRANIPTVNLIDFRYPDHTNAYWHTLQDTPDKCSPESLDAVGTLLLQVIYAQRPPD